MLKGHWGQSEVIPMVQFRQQWVITENKINICEFSIDIKTTEPVVKQERRGELFLTVGF